MIADPIKQGLEQGWLHIDGAELNADMVIDVDVVVVGSGAGGGTSAQLLAEAGFKVVIVEAGPLKSSSDFKMREKQAYPDLYQQSAGLRSKDGAIGILQGRCVGGSTTVNWTTSIRTPATTLNHWQAEFGLTELTTTELAPWFAEAEKAQNISQWYMSPNRSNQVLADGCERLGWSHTVIHRNVNGCANLGYCGMGCPINAKQSMLVTTIPAALNAGAGLFSHTEAWRLQHDGERVTSLHCICRDHNHQRRDITVTINANHFVLAAGALHSPALLMRSNAPDPHTRLGKRTLLHPVVMTMGHFNQPIDAHTGAPQSIYSDQFLWPEDPQTLGFKIEAIPLHPVLLSTKIPALGEAHQKIMEQFRNLQVSIALIRDGFNDHSQGGVVELDEFGDPVLDYPLNQTFWKTAREALVQLATLQFAAGAAKVAISHEPLQWVTNIKEFTMQLEQLTLEKHHTVVSSAHVMGGCGMAASPMQGVVDGNGSHHQLQNLSIFDGSMLPTSLGANPQLTLYGLARRNSNKLIERLKSTFE